MALRDQPYLPLYIQDFLTDEKLNECSASATGVYIKIMCLMHKPEHYGMILLKQKDKQTGEQIIDFALKFAKLLPYDNATIEAGLLELIEEKVLQIDGDFLVQKRMVEDNKLSINRSITGSKGGKTTQEKNKTFAKAKFQANAEYEYDINSNDIKEFESIESILLSSPGNRKEFLPVFDKMMQVFQSRFSGYFKDPVQDYPACERIASKTEKLKSWDAGSVMNGRMIEFIAFWGELVEYIAGDEWLSGRSLNDLSTREWQRLGQHMNKKNLPIVEKPKKEDGLSDYQKEIEEKRAKARGKKSE